MKYIKPETEFIAVEVSHLLSPSKGATSEVGGVTTANGGIDGTIITDDGDDDAAKKFYGSWDLWDE